MSGENPSTSPDRCQVRIVSPPKTGELAVLFCGPLEGLTVHRHQGRPYGCPGETSCPVAIHRARTLWYGYAPVHAWRPDHADWVPAVLEITEALEELLHGRRLRGEVWLIQRDNSRKKTGPVGGIHLEVRDDTLVPPAFDIRPPLYRLYHTTQLALGIANPLPRKLVLQVAKLAPPPGPAAFGLPDPPRPAASSRDALRRLAPRGLAAAVEESAERNGHK